jgi:transcription initiation factor TFIID subunit 1
MSKKELRSFHRPPLNITAGTTAAIQKLKKLSKKEKKVKKRNLSEFVRSAKQLSLRDTGDFVLLEYSVSR